MSTETIPVGVPKKWLWSLFSIILVAGAAQVYESIRDADTAKINANTTAIGELSEAAKASAEERKHHAEKDRHSGAASQEAVNNLRVGVQLNTAQVESLVEQVGETNSALRDTNKELNRLVGVVEGMARRAGT